jgi:hypothetical protein
VTISRIYALDPCFEPPYPPPLTNFIKDKQTPSQPQESTMRDQDNPEKARNCAQTITPAPSGLFIGSVAVLLWIHNCAGNQVFETKYIEQLKQNGMIEPTAAQHFWHLTARGRAFAEAIMALPLPVATWSMPK